MRCSLPLEEQAAQERRERRMQYANSLPQLKVPASIKRAQTSMTYLAPIEPPDRRFKERILEHELEHLRVTELQAARKIDQAMVRAAWHKDQLEQRRQEEKDLERRCASRHEPASAPSHLRAPQPQPSRAQLSPARRARPTSRAGLSARSASG